MDYDAVIERLLAWGKADANVRALVLTGSAAEDASHPLSDRDIQVVVDRPEVVLLDETWWQQLGRVLVVERLPNPGWFPTRLVYYAGGKLDFTIVPASSFPGTVYDRPFRVLLDKDARAATLVRTTLEERSPTPQQFDELLNEAYAAALMCAKAIVRDEPWSAKIRDRDLKAALLEVIEVDHRARYGADYDVRFGGARMRRWMDADVQADLGRCWGTFDLDDTRQALRASLDLFARIAKRAGERLAFPPFDHEQLRHEVEAILRM